MLAADRQKQIAFLTRTGEMGELIAAFDWARTPLGPIETWPDSLKTAVSLILNSRHPMWIGWGPEITFLYNDAYLHVLGRAKHPRALGQPAAKVWAEIWDVCGPLADKVFKNGDASFVDDVRLFMDRGDFIEETFYSFSYSPIRDESGNVTGLFCPSTDVTAKVIGARRLATVSELANSLVEKTTSTACAAAASILAKNADDVPFAVLYLIHPERNDAVREQVVGPAPQAQDRIPLGGPNGNAVWPLGEVIRTGQRQILSIDRFVDAPRSLANQRVANAVVLPVASRGEQEPYGALIAGVNPCRPLDSSHLTFFELIAAQIATAVQNARAAEEEKKRADMLAELDRSKTVFFSNVSHEFRTPLTLMLGPIERLLANKGGLKADEYEELEIAHSNSLRLLKLVNSLLDFARLEAGRLHGSYVPTDLAALTRDIASSFRSAIEAAGLQLHVECAPLQDAVYVDRDMWEKVVLNLLSNAFKYTFQGRISLRLYGIGKNVRLEVEDSGVGIPEHELPRIFERFHRVAGATARTHEGTGIGLALIQEYVKLHGGDISVESRLGEGTTFSVSLPFGTNHLPADQLREGEIEPRIRTRGTDAFINEAVSWGRNQPTVLNEPEPPSEPTVQTAAKPRIVVADDNPDMREHIARTLGTDYEITTVNDGREALEAIRRKTPDLLLSDVMMPNMDGLELLKAVRLEPRTTTLPVVLISARAGDEMRIEGLSAGADDYLIKPFTANELRARVRTQVKLAAARRLMVEREATLRADAEAARDEVIAVLEGMTDGFIALDHTWRITYVNAEAQRLNRISRDEMVGKDYWELFASARGTLVYREFLRAVQAHVPVEFENYYAPWRRWFHVKAFPTEKGGLSVFYEDITERKQAQDELRRSEEKFRSVFTSSAIGVTILTRDLQFHDVNEAFCRISGHTQEQLRACKWIDFALGDDISTVSASVAALTRGDIPTFALEHRYLKKDGSIIWVSTSMSLMRDRNGRPEHLLAISQDVTARKEAERAMLLLGAIVDSSDDAIISKNLNGVITSWNNSAQRLFGYTADEAIGQTVADLLIPADRQEEEPRILERLRRGDRIDHFETVRRRKDGTQLNISLTISPVKDRTGRITGASKIARDITKQKKNEEAIRTLNDQLSEDLTAMTRMQQLSTRLIQAGGFDELLGEIVEAAIEITRADMGNIQLLDRSGVLKIAAHRGFDTPFLEFFDKVHDGLAACGTALEKRERVIVEDVSRSPIFIGTPALKVMLEAGAHAVQSTLLVGRSGQILGMFSTHYRNPSRPSERELRILDLLARQAADLIERGGGEEIRAQLSAIVESTGDAIYTYDFDGTILSWNRAAEELYGYREEDIVGRDADAIVPKDRASELREVIFPSIRRGETLKNYETTRVTSEGRVFAAVLTLSPIRNAQGYPTAISVICRDITERKRAENELRRANLDLEQFAYSASHDLQEPLRTIKIYGELLTRQYATALDGEAHEFLGYVRTAASRMEILIRDLLAYTQVAHLKPPPEATNTEQILASTLEDLSGAIAARNAIITSDPLPAVRVHKTHLRQLLQNIIGNAIKYTSANRTPTIHVSCKPDHEILIFSVRDNGIGIKPEYEERIFGLFKRLHNSDEYSGTGIGLAICQRIVAQYGGRIWVESRWGSGSTFYFTLPR